MLSLIVAIGKNREIGKENELLWSLPADIKHFREYTNEKPIIMGRKTYESIGYPLPNRKNIVISRNPDYKAHGIDTVDSFDMALLVTRNLKQVPVIIGGAQVYERALPIVTDMSVTFVDSEFSDADAFFPEVNFSEWKEISRISHPIDKNHKYAFDIVNYKRK